MNKARAGLNSKGATSSRDDASTNNDEYPWIRRIRLDNFMCHNKLTVEFHKYINIINGQNGTGKSAVLTALAIALGCRPKLTGRCDALKDLIGPYADRSIVE
eukprot:747620-Hanusia_phi.AAC.1